VFDGLFGAESVDVMRARGLPGPGQEAVGERRAVVGQALLDAERGGLNRRFEEGRGAQGRAVGLEGDRPQRVARSMATNR
jgi:hypothetical protein